MAEPRPFRKRRDAKGRHPAIAHRCSAGAPMTDRDSISLFEVTRRPWAETGRPERTRLERILVDMFDPALETTARNDPAVRDALRSRAWN